MNRRHSDGGKNNEHKEGSTGEVKKQLASVQVPLYRVDMTVALRCSCLKYATDGNALQLCLSTAKTQTATLPNGQKQNNMDNKITTEHAGT